MSNPNFIDYVKLYLKSGKGGAGSAHFRREKFMPHGGPDGGDGGRGGHIIMRGNAQLYTLLHLKYTKHIKAEHGTPGNKNLMKGAQGEDKILEVPLGTLAKDAETGELMAEITNDGQEIVIVPGGKGGLGNNNFKTATRQAPEYAQPGEPSIEKTVVLELKVLADVGLVGFPNAGKSTLLSVLTAAKPEIGDYPFTTLTPNLGVVKYRDYKSFVIADIPGIIEGAHLGKGLGLRFLRHIERNSVLLFTIPYSSEHLGKEYKILLKEIKEYNPELLDKPRLIAITKCDLAPEAEWKARKKQLPKEIPHIFISSVTSTHLDDLKDMLWNQIHA